MELSSSIISRAAFPRLGIACLALAIFLSPAPAAVAQTDQPGGAGTTGAPARAGNIYDHRAHQPDQAQVCGGKDGTNVNCPSATQKQQVEEEVQRLLRQSGSDVQGRQQQLNNSR